MLLLPDRRNHAPCTDLRYCGHQQTSAENDCYLARQTPEISSKSFFQYGHDNFNYAMKITAFVLLLWVEACRQAWLHIVMMHHLIDRKEPSSIHTDQALSGETPPSDELAKSTLF